MKKVTRVQLLISISYLIFLFLMRQYINGCHLFPMGIAFITGLFLSFLALVVGLGIIYSIVHRVKNAQAKAQVQKMGLVILFVALLYFFTPGFFSYFLTGSVCDDRQKNVVEVLFS